MPQNEAVIRKLAHQIWEAEGKPEGESDRHWREATLLAKKGNTGLKRSIDPSEAKGPTEPAQPDQT